MDKRISKKLCQDSIMNHLQEGLIYLDKQDNIFFMNKTACKILGLNKKMIGNNFYELFTDNENDFIKSINQFKNKKKEIINKKISYVDNSRKAYLKLSIFCPEELNNNVAILFTDLTLMWNIHVERRKLQNQIRKNFINIMENLRQIAHSIAHEIRNPIASIGGYAHLLSSRWQKEDPGLIEKYLNYITSDTERINKIIEQVERYTDFDEISFKKENIVKIFSHIIQYSLKSAGNKKVEVEISDPSLKDLKMYIDFQKLKKALKGVIKLSILTMEKESPLKIYIDYRDYDININIEFYTKIIKEDDHKFLFNPFYSIGNKKVNFDMSYAQRIIIMHGGIIKIIKKGDNGLEFLINLPFEKRIREK